MVQTAARRPTAAARLTLAAVALAVGRAALAADAGDVGIERMRLSTDRAGILSVESGE